MEPVSGAGSGSKSEAGDAAVPPTSMPQAIRSRAAVWREFCFLIVISFGRLFAGEYRFEVRQGLERLQGSEVVYVEGQYLVAYLRENRVVELEEGELHAR